jgi:hypothetical protein
MTLSYYSKLQPRLACCTAALTLAVQQNAGKYDRAAAVAAAGAGSKLMWQNDE